MSLPGNVEDKLNPVEDPSVGKVPLFKVILCHDNWAVRVSNIAPSALTKSYISLAGELPTSISVLS